VDLTCSSVIIVPALIFTESIGLLVPLKKLEDNKTFANYSDQDLLEGSPFSLQAQVTSSDTRRLAFTNS